jgi:hypothetical protein
MRQRLRYRSREVLAALALTAVAVTAVMVLAVRREAHEAAQPVALVTPAR